MIDRCEIYVPAVARFPDDLKARHELLAPAREAGFKTGLMLVLRDQRDLTPEMIQHQLDNLDPYVGMSTDERPAVFIMHPNKPLEGPQRLNFLDNPEYSREYVEQSIEFASKIPSELTPPSGQMVRFHLNTLILPSQWKSDISYWREIFTDRIERPIRSLATFAQRNNIIIAVETTPIPEFGDMEKSQATLLEDEKNYWADLGNPYPLLPRRLETDLIRHGIARDYWGIQDVNLVVDWCHTYIALKTIDEVRRLVYEAGVDEARSTYMIHQFDIEHGYAEDFDSAVLSLTGEGDVWDVNDASGIFKTPYLQGEQVYFKEGVTLFEGDIPGHQIERLIYLSLHDIPNYDDPKMQKWMDARRLRLGKFVLEINEDDFENSPNTKKSLARVLELV